MKLLLDTHALIWLFADDARLSTAAKQAVLHDDAANWISIVSLWELAIKLSLGKIRLGPDALSRVGARIDADGIRTLSVERAHCSLVASLPFHHRDPFDRLMLAQAIEGDFTLVSRDTAFDAYGVERIW